MKIKSYNYSVNKKKNNKNNKIRLNGNENPENLSEEIIENIKAELENIEFNRYPDTEAYKLRKAYSNYANIEPENIIVGNGSDEMLGMVIGSVINEGKKLLTLSPDFSMYDF